MSVHGGGMMGAQTHINTAIAASKTRNEIFICPALRANQAGGGGGRGWVRVLSGLCRSSEYEMCVLKTKSARLKCTSELKSGK